MKINTKLIAGFISLIAVSACVEDTGSSSGSAAPAVGNSYDLSAFQGARAGQAEMGIQNLGYEAIRNEGLTTWWFNRDTGACAQITTADGRYSNVTMLPPGDC